MTAAVIVIPSRYGSSRFPGKPLAHIVGHSLLERVWRIASAVTPKVTVLVATDDNRIKDHAESFGATVVMTSEGCRNGSERAHEAIQKSGLTPKVVVNLQGDTPLMPPWIVQDLVTTMLQRPEIVLGTVGVRLSRADHNHAMTKIGKNVGGTYVATALDGKALYFSRFPIPYVRQDVKVVDSAAFPFLKHLGIYAFRPETLARYVSLTPTPLEALEQLEQLRALENGIPIHVIEGDLKGRSLASVDTPEDAKEVERIIQTEGDMI